MMASREQKSVTGSARVLVHDDSREAAGLMQEMVHLCGVDCDVSFGGADFRRRLEVARYSLIFLDIYSPDFDAPEAIHHLQAIGYQGAVSLMTGGVPSALETMSNLAAACRVTVCPPLRKPVRFDEVSGVLADVVGKDQAVSVCTSGPDLGVSARKAARKLPI